MENLAKFPWRNFGVEFAILFGSRARGRAIRGDWDIAVWPDVGENYGELLYSLAKFLGVREWDIDIVFIEEDMPCTLAVEVFRGTPIYISSLEKFLDVKFKILNVCWDFFMDWEKVGGSEALRAAACR